MNSDKIFSVVIIGGGFCGAMTLVNLIDKAKEKINITLINKGYPLARGIAYKTYSDLHLLNVEARNMSAYSDQHDHFVHWCFRQKDIAVRTDEIPASYLPRNLYGRYLDELFNEKIKNIPENININIIDDEVIEIEKYNHRFNAKISSGDNLKADKILLATGNSEPARPFVGGSDLLESKNYFSNPWNENAVVGLNDKQTVLIIGTGLTMVDVILGMREKRFNGKIIALSPHGYTILPHRKIPPQRYILDELVPPYNLENLFRLFYKHIRLAHKQGLSGETVVDAIRIRTQDIWQLLTMDDKKKFMVHLRHLWGVARHRLPADIHDQIQQLIKKEKLLVIAGRIKNISGTKKGIELQIRKRKDQSELILNVARIINCTGPQTDIKKQNSPLFESLLKSGIVKPDYLGLGVDATADGRVIDQHNIISNQVFAIGSLLKGKLWESTAIPELRIQATKIADLMLKKSEKQFSDFEMNVSNMKTGL